MSQDWGLDEPVLVELDAEAELVLPHKQQTITLYTSEEKEPM